MTWIPLTVHSQYSVLDASASIKALVAKAKSYELSACALTDHGNLFGVVEFYKECKANAIQALIGCSLYEAPFERSRKERIPGKRNFYSLTLLAKNPTGYHNLCVLSSIGYLEGFYYVPRIDRELLAAHSEGLICLSGDLSSRTSQAALEGKDQLEKEITFYQDLFGDDFYLELQRHPMTEQDQQADGFFQESWLQQKYNGYINDQEKSNQAFLATGVQVVATNDSHYLERTDWRAHQILLNVSSGEPVEIWEKDSMGQPTFRKPNPKRVTQASNEMYFKSPAQMQALFPDCPEAIANTLAVAQKCKFAMDMETKHYPVYIPPSLQGHSYTQKEQQAAAELYLRQLCEDAISVRYTKEKLEKVHSVYPDKDPLQVVKERLEHEMAVIAPKGMCDYLLIVWDFIHWAKSHDIPVGPGRGSGAGSIICYLIGITDIEPLRFGLFFERFINPERLSYPDIDVDICMDRRGDVINYTLDKYGKDNVAQIITFGTMKAKSAIKDVGRVLSVPLAKVNAIAKLIPEELGMTIEKALEVDVDLSKLYGEDDEARRIIDMARSLEGSIRNTGIHAAGIIISGSPLTNHIPICNAKDSEIPVTQFSMKPVEAVGMLKVDFLGLKTLTAIQTCVRAIEVNSQIKIDWRNLPLDDPATFQLLNQGKTKGVFQMEGSGMADLARQLHLDRFEEIIAVLSLYRPGPMAMIPSFIARKHGKEPIEFDHPWLEEILSETYGIMVYQEQVMQISRKVAGYSLGEGDVLRRAMGKKDMQQMAQQREKFRLGAIERGVNEEIATNIFDQMEKFAAYGFNKSHAAAYGYITYVTAYLKANYPKEWMAALMTCDRDDIAKVAKLIGEALEMDIPILPPDINEAGTEFVATPSGIRFAMNAVKGVGTGVIEAIVEEREKKGAFPSLYQFFRRIDTKRVGKKPVENLIQAGAFDYTGWSRDALQQSVEPMFDAAAREQKDQKMGMLSLFSLLGEEDEGRFSHPPKEVKKSTRLELLLKEKELLGFFLQGHPLDLYKDILGRLSVVPLTFIEKSVEDCVFRAAFIIETFAVRISQRTGKKFAICVISDGLTRYEMPVWPEMYEQHVELVQENQLVYGVLQLEDKDGEKRLSCRWLADLTNVNEAMVQECDTAFDRAKLQLERFRHRAKVEKKEKETKGEEKPKMTYSSVALTFDLSSTSLRQVLEAKKIIHRFGGSVPLQVRYLLDEREIAVVHIDESRGVCPDLSFKDEIEEIPSVKECSFLK